MRLYLEQKQRNVPIVLVIVGLMLATLLSACGETASATIATTTAVTTTVNVTTTVANSTTTVALPTFTSAPTPTTAPLVATPGVVAITASATSTLVTTSSSPTVAATTDVTPPPLGIAETPLKATGFDANDAKQLLNELTQQIGVRVVGSQGEHKAADWLESYYKSYGYSNIQRQRFPFSVPAIRTGSVYAGEAGDLNKRKAYGNLLSNVKNQVVKGSLAVYTEGADLRDKVVVIPGNTGYAALKPKVEASVNGGAQAVVFGRPNAALDNTIFNNVTIPVLAVIPGQIPTLQSLAGQAVQLETRVTDGYGGDGYNVVVTRPGPTATAPVLIFGGHYDSVSGTVGASDNGSGTVVTLELAKVLAKKFPGYELRFINFSGEEIGIVGSSYYVNKLSSDEKKRIVAYINLDAVGVGTRFVAIGTKELVNQALDVATENGVRLEDFNLEGTGAGSDHEAFMAKGIKSVFFARWIDPLLHNPGDVPARVYPQALLLAGGMAILVAQKITGS